MRRALERRRPLARADMSSEREIAPFFFIPLADAVERALALLPASVQRTLGAAIAIAAVFTGGLQLHARRADLRQRFPVPYASAFGRVDVASARQLAFWEQLRATLDAQPSRDLYCYPFAQYTHLLVGARNPSRFEFVIPGSYTSPDQVEEVRATLAATPGPYVLAGPALVRADDPIARFIREHYDRVRVAPPLGGTLWQRRGRR